MVCMVTQTQGVRKLVRYGHRVNTKNAAGRTPVALAVEAGKLQVASFLLSKGGDVNVQGGACIRFYRYFSDIL